MLCKKVRFGNLVLRLRSCFLAFRIEVDELEKDQLTGHRTLLDELSDWNPLFSSLEGNPHSEAETMSELE